MYVLDVYWIGFSKMCGVKALPMARQQVNQEALWRRLVSRGEHKDYIFAKALFWNMRMSEARPRSESKKSSIVRCRVSGGWGAVQSMRVYWVAASPGRIEVHQPCCPNEKEARRRIEVGLQGLIKSQAGSIFGFELSFVLTTTSSGLYWYHRIAGVICCLFCHLCALQIDSQILYRAYPFPFQIKLRIY
jgi:hypothetical protein